MNFGTLKDIFLQQLIESYTGKNEYGKELYKKFLSTLKESETLKTSFIVFKNIEEKTINNEINAVEYLKESISLFDTFKGKNSLKSEIKKLTSLLDEHGVNYNDTPTKKIHESLQSLITTKKEVSNIDLIQEQKSNLVQWLMIDKQVVNENKNKDLIKKGVNPKKFLEIATQKFNEKYGDTLTEEEKNILKVLRENNQEKIKTLVSELVKENISLVNKHLDESSENIVLKSKLLETKDTIYKMMENNDSFKENVLKLYELKKNLKND